MWDVWEREKKLGAQAEIYIYAHNLSYLENAFQIYEKRYVMDISLKVQQSKYTVLDKLASVVC